MKKKKRGKHRYASQGGSKVLIALTTRQSTHRLLPALCSASTWIQFPMFREGDLSREAKRGSSLQC